MRRRKGGTLASGIAVILFLLVFFTVLEHVSGPFNTSSAGSSGGAPSRGSCTAEQVIGGAAPAYPDMSWATDSLASSSYTVSLPLSTPSSADSELLNDSWWREVLASSGQS